jgi:hypothetical protein
MSTVSTPMGSDHAVARECLRLPITYSVSERAPNATSQAENYKNEPLLSSEASTRTGKRKGVLYCGEHDPPRLRLRPRPTFSTSPRSP